MFKYYYCKTVIIMFLCFVFIVIYMSAFAIYVCINMAKGISYVDCQQILKPKIYKFVNRK